MNKVILTGNLTRDPEIKTTPSGKSVTNASIATSKSFTTATGEKRDEVQFHNLVIWGKQAEVFAKFLKKGKKVLVIGELVYREWTKEDGSKVKVSEVNVNEFEFISPREAETTTDRGTQYNDDSEDEINVPF